ncbi:sensor domain-containing diguanylate cyclase [Legionella maioricensis]|uniref:Sensor domain-containing diguanylate cyclase n=1 Tax=Legionella maioricensis TaxID=2896528 RepID=A0A9X2IA27_9GAMM|nr:sensor domain-containing diguanylate cyclase [Legionella maioricensis]MCL9683136.1 sensor domain-containing diguanylate cyclase [Legionella maioricensis]MCL9688035.1 sensor domain-containing diguanylate cyclase [Legionella maioricensis]
MIKPQKPKNEIQRLKALHSLNILDTKSEERFDCITRVAQNLFNVPIASVSFVDEEREWFKSKYGLQFEETPREISFGAHVILEEDIMIVKDTLKDVRFKDNPLVLGNPEIRFYLGCPLKSKGRFNIGTLCLIDHKVQKFTDADLDIVKELAATVEAEFDARLSITDELTGLPNRQGFLLAGKQIIKRCKQFDKNLLLLYFDINKLKLTNDHYGHDEGDKVLKIFSQQLLKSFRRSDAVARLGGDKFCVLCPGMFKDYLPNVMKRLQNKLLSVQTNHPIEFTMGALPYDRSYHSINSLIEEAYEKIYEDKRHYH